MLLPMAFDAMSSMDAIQSGLDQNCTLETLTLNNKTIIFERNQHTSKVELVKCPKLPRSQSIQAGTNKQDDSNHPIAVSQCVGTSLQ